MYAILKLRQMFIYRFLKDSTGFRVDTNVYIWSLNFYDNFYLTKKSRKIHK